MKEIQDISFRIKRRGLFVRNNYKIGHIYVKEDGWCLSVDSIRLENDKYALCTNTLKFVDKNELRQFVENGMLGKVYKCSYGYYLDSQYLDEQQKKIYSTHEERSIMYSRINVNQKFVHFVKLIESLSESADRHHIFFGNLRKVIEGVILSAMGVATFISLQNKCGIIWLDLTSNLFLIFSVILIFFYMISEWNVMTKLQKRELISLKHYTLILNSPEIYTDKWFKNSIMHKKLAFTRGTKLIRLVNFWYEISYYTFIISFALFFVGILFELLLYTYIFECVGE